MIKDTKDSTGVEISKSLCDDPRCLSCQLKKELFRLEMKEKLKKENRIGSER
jgi:hypothetical protein